MTFFRTKRETIQQMVGDVSRVRIVQYRQFVKAGVDLAGPITTKNNLKIIK